MDQLDRSPRYLIKKSLVAHVATQEGGKFPTFLVVDNTKPRKTMSFFAWAIRAKDISTMVEHNTPYSMSLFESDNIDVQLEPNGEFISAASALETGKARFEDWRTAWVHAGLISKEEALSSILQA
jgi:hypothetical protein